MIQNTYIGSLLDNSCSKNHRKEAKDLFYKNCSDKESIATISQLLKSIEFLKKGTKLPAINLKNTSDYTLSFDRIKTSKNTVIYFWPKELGRIQNMAKRVNYLTKNHPNVHFIGVDGQLDNYNWKAYIKANNLSTRNQFQIIDSLSNNWFVNEIPRAILINKNGVIQNNFTFLSHHNFEKQLAVLEKN
jgi:peroxiredoxin